MAKDTNKLDVGVTVWSSTTKTFRIAAEDIETIVKDRLGYGDRSTFDVTFDWKETQGMTSALIMTVKEPTKTEELVVKLEGKTK